MKANATLNFTPLKINSTSKKLSDKFILLVLIVALLLLIGIFSVLLRIFFQAKSSYPSTFDFAFMEGCDMDKRKCKCALDYLHENYSYETVKNFTEPDQTVALKSATYYCMKKDGLLK